MCDFDADHELPFGRVDVEQPKEKKRGPAGDKKPAVPPVTAIHRRSHMKGGEDKTCLMLI